MLVLLADIAPSSRLWGWSRFVLGTRPFRGAPGLRFAKLLGSGRDGGFGLRPSPSRVGWFAVFDDHASADAFRAGPLARGFVERARECLSLKLEPWSCRGSWSGFALPPAIARPAVGPVAALTRASIRPSRARDFWRWQPASEAALAAAPGCRLAIGVGEAPLLRQATLSVWDSCERMEAYARGGAHGDAARRAYAEGYFSESMFVRFRPVDPQGLYRGRPLELGPGAHG